MAFVGAAKLASARWSASGLSAGHEGQVAIVDGVHQDTQIAQAVDVLTWGSEFEPGRTVALFHSAVVLDEGHVVDSILDAGDEAELVVELEVGRASVVVDAGAVDAGGEIVTDFILEACGVLGAEELATCPPWTTSRAGGTHDGGAERLELGFLVEHDVGGMFDLREAPMGAVPEVTQHRTEALRPTVEVRGGGATLSHRGRQPGAGLRLDRPASRRCCQSSKGMPASHSWRDNQE